MVDLLVYTNHRIGDMYYNSGHLEDKLLSVILPCSRGRSKIIVDRFASKM